MKKGVIEIGFSWIFILLAGVVILGLFSYITVQQGGFFRTMLSANLLVDLDAVFVGATVSKNTAATFDIPDTRFTFSCNSYGIEGVSHSLLGKFVFAPPELSTSRLITWSKAWSLGFRVTNFLYLTSPYIKYYIVYPPEYEQLAQDIYYDLPMRIEKELIPVSAIGGSALNGRIENHGYERVHVLVLYPGSYPSAPLYGASPPSVRLGSAYDSSAFASYALDDIIFLYVTPEPDYTRIQIGRSSSFSVSFQNRDENGMRYPSGGGYTQTIYDLSGVYAAFISGNQEMFMCIMERAFRRAGDVVDIYNKRRVLLDGMGGSCNYGAAAPYFTEMSQELRKSYIDVTAFRGLIRNFEETNERAERSSCPLLY